MADLTGHDVGRYHIIEQLGKGGMAVVYKAFDRRLEREVAIKFIRTERVYPDELAQMLARFEREGKALARMEHPHIIRIHDYGEHEGVPYLVMNYLPGGTLKEYARIPMPYIEAVRLLLPVARALDYAHKRGVVHRDVKPANILITEAGEPMLSDFGIARILETESGTLTGTGVGIGTPEYMAPEQCRGEVSPAVDIYALGVVLYELITGKPPYQADTPLAVMIKQSRDPLPRPSSFVANLPVEVEQILYKALAKEPEDRYASMIDLISAMEKLLQLKENDIAAFSLPSKRDSSMAARPEAENEPVQQPDAAFAEAGKPVVNQSGATPIPVETLESAPPDEAVSERGKAITGDKLDAATEETFFPETMDIPGDHFQTIVDAPPEPDLSKKTVDFREMDFETKVVAAPAPEHLQRQLPPVEEARTRAGQQAAKQTEPVRPAPPTVILRKAGMDKTWLMGGAAALGGLLLICMILFGLGAGGIGPLAGLFITPGPTQSANAPAVEASETAVKLMSPTPSPGEPDCSKPEVFCVGLVTAYIIDDRSFDQSTWEGVKQAENDLGAVVKYIETTDFNDYAKNIATFADAKYDVVVTVSFTMAEATVAAAKKYPDVKFIGVDQTQFETIPNLAGLVFPEDQAGFLAGALAAQMTKTGKIGAVLGTDAVPAVWRFGEGFRAGAMYINPDIEINVVYHNDVGFDKTFNDPEWGKTTAIAMIDKQVDIIFGAGGKTGDGALLGAAERGVYAIGLDTDQYYTVPEAQKVLLSSAMKLLTPGTFDLIKLAKDDKFPGGNFTGKCGYAPYHDIDGKVPAEVKTKMIELQKALADGSLQTNVAPVRP